MTGQPELQIQPEDRRPDNEASPSGLTGVCADGKHDLCRGRVYAGHIVAGGQRGAQFNPCRCDCHDLPDAA